MRPAPVAIVIPFFRRNVLRLEAFGRVFEHLHDLGLPIIVSQGSNPADARNYGAWIANAHVLIFNDADTIIPHEQIREARRLAELDPGLVYAYDLYVRTRDDDEFFNPPSFGCVVIRQECFEEVGGFDASLETHEDVDFAQRSQKLWPVRRVQGIAEHIWHGPRRADGTPLDVDAVKARESAERWAASTV